MNKKESNLFDGIGLGVAFIVIGTLLPFLFFSKITIAISAILISLGIMGLGLELDNLFPYDSGYTNIFMGIGFILFGTSMMILFFGIITKILFIILTLIGIFAVVSGILTYLNSKKVYGIEKQKYVGNSNVKIVTSSIFTISGFIANLVTIISFFR